MARSLNRLTARQVATLGAGYHADGGGLYLQVTPSGSRTWIFRYRTGKRLRDMGLGPVRDVTLKQARAAAAAARQQRAAGLDPIEARDAARRAARAANERLWGQAVDDYIANIRSEWKSTNNPRAKKVMWEGQLIGTQENQWRQSLREYGPPADTPVRQVTTQMVLDGLRPIWKPRDQGGKTETATRVRGRVERIWDAERVAGNVTGDNPARWNGLLEHLLPAPEKLKQRRHHPALPYGEAPALYAALRFRTSRTARALRFLLLTAARTQEVTGMPDLSEIDFERQLWLIPGERMKAEVDHEVPLVPEAMELLRGLPRDKPPFALSENSMLYFLQRHPPKGLGFPYTVHGLRSTFRDWVSETTNHSREVAEMAIAHQVKDKTEAAYRRGKLREKRRVLMGDWLQYLTRDPRTPIMKVATAVAIRSFRVDAPSSARCKRTITRC